MKILYNAIPDHELITIEEAKYIQEQNKRRVKMSQEAKRVYQMSKKQNDPETNHISQGPFDTKMA